MSSQQEPTDFAQLQLLEGPLPGAAVLFGPGMELRGDKLRQTRVVGAKDYAQGLRATRSKMRSLVFAFLVGRGAVGATDQEMQHGLGLHANSQAPRRVELVQAGVVKNSGRRRSTTSGHSAIVWVVRPDEKPSRGP